VLTVTATGPAAQAKRTVPLLSLHSVSAGYGRIEIVADVQLEIHAGTVTALLGPNGAGKTTTLGVLSGLIRPWTGCRHVAGRHANDATADELARLGICMLREGRSVFPNLSVSDNLLVATSAGARMRRIEDVAYTLFPVLSERRDQLAGTLSGGERQMLALARGLGVDPAVLLIDELSMGLAPRVVGELYEAVARVADAGVAVFVVEQFASVALKYADTAMVMTNGRITYAGAASGALEAAHRAYLGSESR